MSDRVTILTGDALAMLKTLPDESVQCCVTSPPYWGLRDYGMAAQIGKEPTYQEFVEKMVSVFSEVRRVLKHDGVCWVNFGDSYASCGGSHKGRADNQTGVGGKRVYDAFGGDAGNRIPPIGLKPKDLVGIPWRVAFALQADGWYLRSDIIWSKPNPMPESVMDRPTKSHEYIFLLSKSEKYFYDSEAVKEPAVSTDIKKFTDGGADKQCGHSLRHAGFNGRYAEKLALEGVPEKRNRRTVWSVPVCGYKEAHFATYPPDLIKPCILAGTRPGDMVLDPFGGSFTTGQVALELGRKVTLIELNPEYVEMGKRRLNKITIGLGL